jgi:hypothetical protein
MGRETSSLFQSLKPDDVVVEGVEYNSECKNDVIMYNFESCEVLKLRNTIDDVLEKAILVEEVLKGTQ